MRYDERRTDRRRDPIPVLFTHEGVDYLLLDTLEQGSLGEQVYLCRQRVGKKKGEWVQVRMLDEHASWKSHQRLMETAQLGLLLSHPAIARVRGLHQLEGRRYLVSEHVTGISLNMACGYTALSGQRLSEPFALSVCSAVAEALAYTHALRDATGRPLGLVHRDICPYNLLVEDDGQVKLLGVLTAFSSMGPRAPTSARVIRGELDFSAPERLCPEPEGLVDARSDLFSLGLVMLELLTGMQLYATDEVEQAATRLALNPSRYEGWTSETDCWASVAEMARRAEAFQPEHIESIARRVSPSVRRILHRLLRRVPSERYATAAELKADLDACLQALSSTYGLREAGAELLTLSELAKEHERNSRPSDDLLRRLLGSPS